MANGIADRIKDYYPSFSKGQKKLSAAILNDYDKVVYMTASKLGRFVGVSESTVVRFANQLGYDGYSDFQKAIQELVRTKLTPNQRIDVTKKRIGHGDILTNVIESDIAKIRTTFDNMDRNEFHAACNAILSAKRIYIMGARSSEPLAMVLKYNLSLIFDNITLVAPKSTAEVFEQMFTIGENDLLIAFSFPRYSSKMVNAVKFARQNKAKVIVFTDSPNSPLAEFASYLLIAQSDMASFMDSLVAPISIINAIIVEITTRREALIRDRFDRLEKIWDEYDVYTKK
ncbi:MAG: MurR/RpiR family transcriptional regulator [Ruminococcaceae bacterium]|nr:MurR/RpiR family transcriptional regulator [Oscillospiraceae bacterium]